MKLTSALRTTLVAAALGCAGCSRLSVDWTATGEDLHVHARGPAHAMLIVLAGPPSGPHTMPGDAAIWTTVGPDKPWRPGGVEVARVVFDANGEARATIPVGPLPSDVVFIQAVAIAHDAPRALAASDCMAVTRRSGTLAIRSHLVEVLDSSIWWRIAAVAGIVALGFLLRRLRGLLLPLGRRAVWLPVVLPLAALLVAARIRAPHDAAVRLDAPPPFLPNAVDAARRNLDPLDRVTRPGLHALIDGVRGAAPAGAAVAIVPESARWDSKRDAWQAQWMLWPMETTVTEAEADPFARRGVYLTFGNGPQKPGARVIFKNQAGCLFSVDAGEPR